MNTREIIVGMLDNLTEEQLQGLMMLLKGYEKKNDTIEKRIEDIESKKNLSKTFNSVEELMEDLNAED